MCPLSNPSHISLYQLACNEIAILKDSIDLLQSPFNARIFHSPKMYNDYAELYIQMVEVNCALFWSETGFGQG